MMTGTGFVQAQKLSKGEQTRQNILTAAEKSFAELGYDAAKLESVADAVGIKRAAIFYYFRNKQELFEDLTRDIHVSLIEQTRLRLADATDPWEQLMLLVEAWLDFMVARPTAARLILRACADAAHSDNYPANYSSNALSLLRGIIRDGIASGRFADVHSMYLVNLLSGSILHYVCNPDQLGDDHPYRPDDPAELAAFKGILRKTARTVLNVS
ncbi:TetR/AcrR family transcriptional regulator [Sphingobium sp.]|uniref:TetR/AcrR family transcriptional regulator n=1 Tax=Sphingobium sp. TaxID=1912891 RepID=UPI0028BD5123|nr:TetR/AcrR family transcriptional regulator [Sphingobium sp.]